MRAITAQLLHILAVHYIFVLFIVGFPCLYIGLKLNNNKRLKRFFIPYLFFGIFVIALFGEIIFPTLNLWYLENYGKKGEAVIVRTIKEQGWFSTSPEMRLTLKIEPEYGESFIEAVSTMPPLDEINRLQVGYRIEVWYAPQYTHDIAIASW